MKHISLIIRTFNNARFFTDQLQAVRKQRLGHRSLEIIVADEGSKDGTLFLAEFYGCRILDVRNQSQPVAILNAACKEACGEILVFLSADGIPVSENWLLKLIEPIEDQVSVYSYGALLASRFTAFSRRQFIEKYFPEESQVPQYGSYANNANAAIRRSVWASIRFDESLNALEDIQMVKDLGNDGQAVAYVADAQVYDIKTEDFATTLSRARVEGHALRAIYPDIHYTLVDVLFYLGQALAHDIRQAFDAKCLHSNLYQILESRIAEYWGAYLGHWMHRKRSDHIKQTFLSPGKAKQRKV